MPMSTLRFDCPGNQPVLQRVHSGCQEGYDSSGMTQESPSTTAAGLLYGSTVFTCTFVLRDSVSALILQDDNSLAELVQLHRLGAHGL